MNIFCRIGHFGFVKLWRTFEHAHTDTIRPAAARSVTSLWGPCFAGYWNKGDGAEFKSNNWPHILKCIFRSRETNARRTQDRELQANLALRPKTIKSLKTTINDSKIFRERLITYFVAIHQSVLHVYICEIITFSFGLLVFQQTCFVYILFKHVHV